MHSIGLRCRIFGQLGELGHRFANWGTLCPTFAHFSDLSEPPHARPSARFIGSESLRGKNARLQHLLGIQCLNGPTI